VVRRENTPVVLEDLTAGLAVVAEHRLVDVDKYQSPVLLAHRRDQRIGLAHLLDELPAADARLDGDERDSRLGQRGVDLASAAGPADLAARTAGSPLPSGSPAAVFGLAGGRRPPAGSAGGRRTAAERMSTRLPRRRVPPKRMIPRRRRPAKRPRESRGQASRAQERNRYGKTCLLTPVVLRCLRLLLFLSSSSSKPIFPPAPAQVKFNAQPKAPAYFVQRPAEGAGVFGTLFAPAPSAGR